MFAGCFSKAPRRLTARSQSPVFQIAVSSTNPILFYCAVDEHCQNGMVGVINPSSGQTLGQFKSAASGATSGPVPNTPYGGNLVNAGQSSAASSSAPATSSAQSGGAASSGVQTSGVQTTGGQATGGQTSGAA